MKSLPLSANPKRRKPPRKNLIKSLKITEIQAQAILDMQLRRLASLERKKINDEHKGEDQTYQIPGRVAEKPQEDAWRHLRRTPVD